MLFLRCLILYATKLTYIISRFSAGLNYWRPRAILVLHEVNVCCIQFSDKISTKPDIKGTLISNTAG